MDLNAVILQINDFLWSWPLVIAVIIISTIVTVALGFVQFRYFFRSWRLTLFSRAGKKEAQVDMTPFQAFLNTLSASLGNGSLAGMATAVYSGGPGAAFWVFVLGLMSMSLRFSEVFLSSVFGARKLSIGPVGGPMIYLSKVPGGFILPYMYAFFCFLLSLSSGNAMQANTIRIGLVHIFGLQPLMIAFILFGFMVYVMLGGAQRIIKVSDQIVPIKVGVFFISAFIILMYHFRTIGPALKLIIQGAFSPIAIGGGLLGFGMQQAMRFGIARSFNASEAGLGTAAVLFGGSSSKDPVKNGIMGMLGTFISSNLVCFSLILMIVASGVWNNGQTSLDLTISAYETVFGSFGAWIVTFLSISFGLGVLVAYAYIGRACWTFITGGRFVHVFTGIFCIITFLGALAKVDLIWNSADLVIAGLLSMNMYGILVLLPTICKGLLEYQKKYG